jgi:hypothetical protein
MYIGRFVAKFMGRKLKILVLFNAPGGVLSGYFRYANYIFEVEINLGESKSCSNIDEFFKLIPRWNLACLFSD